MAPDWPPTIIEPMHSSDLGRVEEIDRLSFPTSWQTSVYKTELRNRAATYLVARSGSLVVGFGGIWTVGAEAHITILAVDPDYRGRKIGERLLLSLMEEAIMRRASHVALEVRETNCPAQSLYRKYAFRQVDIRRAYYTDTGEDALVMWADGIRTPGYRQRLYELRRQLDFYQMPIELLS